MASRQIPVHISQQFDKELNDLRANVLTMGGLVEDHLNRALTALSNEDFEAAEYVATHDYKVNAFEVEIDEECSRILLKRQPAAGDLRLVLAVSKTITDLERVGDEVEKVGRMALDLMGSDSPKSYYVGILAMGFHVKKMLHDVLDAFARMDSQAAFQVAQQDPQVDEENDAIMRHLITYMMEDPRSISQVLNAVLAVRAFERIGDHANNIGEYIIYFVEGKDVRHTSLQDIEQELKLSSKRT
ncbi:MAG TPA: phosphate transport system regulatory protein PhoU [Gammaproteobacteria bacterium]|nr:phosphate transport system regulatory protein PhoU [Gammaproteobacteria bacterium]|tara:strand:+ start:297 stop:1025 length:729 start_codon:yes stop_codon:yes gene_type:complete